jgi:serine/threonine-protein kinase HipA
MTSESAFVWTHLPGDVLPTLCGRFSQEPNASGVATGKFVYGQSYLTNPDALALDPVGMPLASKDYATTALRGVFGPLLDAMPDDWGRYVIDRTAGEQKFPVGYMLKTSDDAVGNISFSASPGAAPVGHDAQAIGMDLLPQARQILLGLEQGKPVPPELALKVRPNTALGGARPKLTVAHQGHLWLAKFGSTRDQPDLPYARIEAAMLDLARLSGIDRVQAEVALGDVLLVRRFDRQWVEGPLGSGWRRDAFLSARTVFHANHQTQPYVYAGSYARLAQELQRYSARPAVDQEELFRRMVFNALISNTDDHERNHGLLADDEPGTYRLSPAYDLVPSIHATRRRYHAMTLGAGESLATRENLVADCTVFGLSRPAADAIIEKMQACVAANWEACLQKQGVPQPAIARLETCFRGIPESIEQADDAAHQNTLRDHPR